MPTYKDEKTGLWYCKFVYMDWTGQRKQKKKMGFRLQKEAKQFEIDFLSKTAKNCDMSFGSMVDIYMEDTLISHHLLNSTLWKCTRIYRDIPTYPVLSV